MNKTVTIVTNNIKRLRGIKKLSQKEVALTVGMLQGQYSRIENGKVEPTISTLEKIAKVFEVSVGEFFRNNNADDAVNLPLMEKIKMIDALDKEEKEALIKLIDMAISKKLLKENLANLVAAG